ncbi:uncharacterized protein LOC121391111 [Gigantopelta aegis]|uniref:uncharacterized protein LOC121391111 n=1 Tax=Gigantopelta aegis TaxID=1735272 RepID=UPI001B88D949|nr:uncharacterized protein LOC121391111 [Gigantopelta aegis]
MALLPPGGLPEIVFSFDTTGSMSSCLAEVRGRLKDMIQRLQADIPAIRIAVFAHGDYCDKDNYVTKFMDFTDDVKKLCDFVSDVSATGGGDSDECYELVLYQVRDELSWTPGSNRALVMIGDSNPHEPNYPDNKLKLDWRVETDNLANMGIKIYAVQCKSYGAETFYKTMAEKTSGRHLKMDSFSNIFDFLMAICYREQGEDMLQVYEKEVRQRCGDGSLHKDLHGLFSTLRDPTTIVATGSPLCKAKPKPTLKKVAKPASLKKGSVKRPVLKAKTKRRVKSKMCPVRLLRRENVPENNFMLRDLRWSPWVKVVCPDKPDDTWEKKRGERRGYRKIRIFPGKTTLPALYEVAVQSQRRSRRHVVFSRFAKRIPADVGWESRLLGRSDVRRQVDEVVKSGCSLFIRRVTLRSKTTAQNALTSLRLYDYAWRRISRKRSNHRSVVKGDFKISDEAY